jgi:signal peptidase I
MLVGRNLRNTLIRILVLAAASFVTFKFMLLPIRVTGISMEPTYHNHAVNFINRTAYLWHEPRRGDIIGIRMSAGDALSTPSEMLMKRIIALPGETVSFHNGVTYVNHAPLREPYLKVDCDWEAGPFPCGTNEYYVVGDNRAMPFMLHTQGRAERERIIGKLLL